MLYRNYLSLKYTQYKKKTWSAPLLMSGFLIICLLLVFSLEEVGLFRKENNLNNQVMHIGKSK